MSDLSRLPHDPVGFFELSEPYDRRDLKRAYGKAIRKYKPETHPQEFQLVRDAYERLERQLRYGQKQSQRAEAADAWAPPSEGPAKDQAVPASNRQRARPSAPKAELSVRELALIDPSAALKKVQAKTRRTAQDFYLSAILIDATNERATAKYLGELIEGLVVFPDDPGLISLATEYLRTEVPDSMAAKIVEFVSQKLRTPLFYMLTEALWLRMVNEMPFDQFSGLLLKCEKQIAQTQPITKRTFYLRLLRTVIWVAPHSWVNGTLKEIESHSAGMEQGTEFELEFLSEIQQVRQASQTHSDPVRAKLLKALCLTCQPDEPTAIAQVNELLSELGRDSTAVQAAFPINETLDPNGDEIWISLVLKMVFQLESYAWDNEEISRDRIYTQIVELLQDLQPTSTKVLAGVDRGKLRYSQMPMIAWMTAGTVVGAIPICGLAFMLINEEAIGLWIIALVILLFVGLLMSFSYWLFPKYLQSRMEKYQHRQLMRDYARLWRSRLFRFAQSNHENINVHTVRIDAVGSKTGNVNLSDTVKHFVHHDAGLCVYAALRTVMR